MRATLAGLALMGLIGCDGGSDTDDKGGETDTTPADDTDDGGGGEDRVENEVALDVELDAARFTCFTPAADAASATWITQSVDPAKVVSMSIAGVVNDFDDEEPPDYVEYIEARLWYDDVSDGPPDVAELADESGAVELTAPSCQPLSYLTYPDPALDKARPTYKAHQVYGYSLGTFDAEFISVSNDTYNVIPAILGVPIKDGTSIIAGTAFDCSREPDTLSEVDAGKIEGAQVVVRNLDGSKPDGVAVRYFVENFPDRDQTSTSADGLWAAVNVPPGEIRVEMWGKVGGADVLLGVTEFTSYPNSINIANIFAGYDSVKYPDDCLVPPT
jgi:hypothetical protein